MPKVGGKHFEYTAAGEKKAREYSEKTGQNVESYKHGGSVMSKESGNSAIDGLIARSDAVNQTYQEGGNVEKQPTGGNIPQSLPPTTGGNFTWEDGGKVTKEKLKTGIYDTSGGTDEFIHTPISRNESKYKVNIPEAKHKVDTGKYGSWKDNTPADAGVKDYWKSQEHKVDTGKYGSWRDNTPADAGVADYWQKNKQPVDTDVEDYWNNQDFTKKTKIYADQGGQVPSYQEGGLVGDTDGDGKLSRFEKNKLGRAKAGSSKATDKQIKRRADVKKKIKEGFETAVEKTGEFVEKHNLIPKLKKRELTDREIAAKEKRKKRHKKWADAAADRKRKRQEKRKARQKKEKIGREARAYKGEPVYKKASVMKLK